MRRLKALLIVAGLAAAPSIAAAGPSTNSWATTDTGEASSRPRLGVLVTPLTPELRRYFGSDEDRGVLVAHVEPDTPAAAAGLEVGDVIVGVRGQTVQSARDVIAAIATVNKDEPIVVDLVRGKKAVALEAMLSRTTTRPNLNGLPDWLRELVEPFAVRSS